MYRGEENSPAAPFGNQTRDFSVMSPALWREGGERDRQTDRQRHRDRETELELENFILREL